MGLASFSMRPERESQWRTGRLAVPAAIFWVRNRCGFVRNDFKERVETEGAFLSFHTLIRPLRASAVQRQVPVIERKTKVCEEKSRLTNLDRNKKHAYY